MQIKKDFSGYFIHPIKSIRSIGEDIMVGKNPFVERDFLKPFAERTVVRPTYSYLGKFSISDKALGDIINLVSKEIPEIDSISEIYIRNRSDGAIIEVGLMMKFGFQIVDVSKKFQKLIAHHIEEMTSINILSVDMEIICLN